MDGVLEGACLLGLGKLTCSLFFLSTYPGLISFCFSSLLMFTDLLVTGFLLILWFADPSPLPSPDGDHIALRFLLFLGNTYAAALLLSVPLVLAETALRRYAGAAAAEEKNGAEADAERDELRRLGHVAGYLSCLSAWVVSGLWAASVDQRPQELDVAACLRTKRPLISCLPRVVPCPPEPSCGSMAVLSLALLVFLALEMVVWARRVKHDPVDGDDDDDIHNGYDKSTSGWRQLAPSPGRPSSSSIDLEKTNDSCVVPVEKRWPEQQQEARRPEPPVMPDPGSAPGDPTPLGQGTDGGLGLGWRTLPCLGLAVTTGLVWMISLCLLPLTLSVNVPLIQTLHAVAAVCMDNGAPPLRRRRRGEAGASVLQSWKHYCGV